MILNRFSKRYYSVQLRSELRMGRSGLTSVNLQWGMAGISSVENKRQMFCPLTFLQCTLANLHT